MARRKRKAAKTPTQTRKQILLERKQAKERQTTLMILGPLAILVVGVIGLGVYREKVQKPRQPVARVDGQTISAADYRARVEYERLQLLNNLDTFAQFAQVSSDGGGDFITQFAQQSRTALPGRVVDMLVDDWLVRAEAESRGITVTDDEVAEEIYGQLPSGRSRAGTATAAAITATAMSTATAAAPTATLSQARVVDATREAEREYQRFVREAILDQLDISEARYKEIIRTQIYRRKLGEVLGEAVSTTDAQVDAEYLLFSSSGTAKQAADMLDAGASWSEVVSQFAPPPRAEGDEASAAPPEDATAPEAPAEDVPSSPEAGEAATGEKTASPPPAGPTATLAAGDTASPPAASPTTTAAASATPAATATTAPSPTPMPSPTPDPFYMERGERQWFTRQVFKDELGLSDAEVTDLLKLTPGSPSQPMDGRRGTYIVYVFDVDEDRALPEQEIETRRAGALDDWLKTRRIQASVDRYPTESLVPEEALWFVQGYERIIGTPINTFDPDTLSVSTTAPEQPPASP